MTFKEFYDMTKGSFYFVVCILFSLMLGNYKLIIIRKCPLLKIKTLLTEAHFLYRLDNYSFLVTSHRIYSFHI